MASVHIDQAYRTPRVGLRQSCQRLGISEGREPVAPSPVVWHRSAVPEESVVLLDLGVQQELGLDVQVARIACECVGPAHQRAGEEEVLGAIVRVARRRRDTRIVASIQVRYLDQQVSISLVARYVEHLVAPDQSRVVRAAVGLGKPGPGAGQIRLDQRGDALRVLLSFPRQLAIPEPPTDRHTLRVDHRIERIPITLDQRRSYAHRRAASATC